MAKYVSTYTLPKPKLFDEQSRYKPCLLCGEVKPEFYIRIETSTGDIICADCFAVTDYGKKRNDSQLRMF